MNSCEKASHICDKAQYDEATLFEKLRLKFHLLRCTKCALHSKKNGELTSLCNKARLSTLSEEDKTVLKEKLKNILQ